MNCPGEPSQKVQMYPNFYICRSMEIEDDDEGWAALCLRCDANHAGPWKCEARISTDLLTPNGSYDRDSNDVIQFFFFLENKTQFIRD